MAQWSGLGTEMYKAKLRSEATYINLQNVLKMAPLQIEEGEGVKRGRRSRLSSTSTFSSLPPFSEVGKSAF